MAFAEDALEFALETLEGPLDLLSRPTYALGEAVGSARKGRSIWGGFKRGLTRGERGSRYGTLGEQIAGEESPWLGMGIDIVTDPISLIPAAKFTRLGLKAAAGSKLGRAAIAGAKGSESLQKLGRLVLPVDSHLGIFAKDRAAADEFIKLAKEAEEATDLESSIREVLLSGAAKKTKLVGSKAADTRRLAAEHIEAGGPGLGLSSGSAAVDELADVSKQILDDLKDKAASRGLLVEEIENYFPQFLKDDVKKRLRARGPRGSVTALAEMLGVPEEVADDIWRYQSGRPVKAGHIELPRKMLYPKDWLERDPLQVLPRYIREVTRRIAYSDRFGVDGAKLEDLLKRMDLPMDISEELRQAVRSPFLPEGSTISQDAARGLLNTMIMSKMGITSSIANLTGNVNTYLVHGGSKFTRGLLRLGKKERELALPAYHRQITHTLQELIGGGGSGPLANLTSKYLKWVGFTPVETINRVLSASAGVVDVEDVLRTATKFTPELESKGLSKGAFNYFQKFGRLPDKAIQQVGLRAANRLQHANSWVDLPIGWRTPGARLFTQYKSFIVQQSRFIAREVMKPAIRYLDTNGKEGSIAPLLRASVAFGVAGEANAWLREKIRGTQPRRRKIDKRDPMWKLIENMSYVGSFGVASDIVNAALRDRLMEWAAGPSISEGFALGGAAARFVANPEDELENIPEGLYNLLGRGPAPFIERAFK